MGEKKPLTEEQWSCLRIRMQAQEEKKRIVPFIIKRLAPRFSAKRVRRAMTELSEGGYLSGREYLPTERAERLYAECSVSWEALCHVHGKLGMKREEREQIADHLIAVYPASVLDEITEQYREELETAAGETYGELITDTDFSGKLPSGSYQVAFELLVGGGAEGGEGRETAQRYRRAELSASFHPVARLVIAPLRSCLELSWIGTEERLWGIRCLSKNESMDFRSEDGRVRLPLTAFTFEYVPNYKILHGELPLQVLMEERSTVEDGRDRKNDRASGRAETLKSRAVLLELPLACG